MREIAARTGYFANGCNIKYWATQKPFSGIKWHKTEDEVVRRRLRIGPVVVNGRDKRIVMDWLFDDAMLHQTAHIVTSYQGCQLVDCWYRATTWRPRSQDGGQWSKQEATSLSVKITKEFARFNGQQNDLYLFSLQCTSRQVTCEPEGAFWP